MRATFKNAPDEFSCEPPTSSSSIDRVEVKIDLFLLKYLFLKTFLSRDMKKIQVVFECFI